METQSYEVQVMKNRKWEVARVFTPDDKATADSLYISLRPGMGYEGKKLIAEVMDGEGMVRAKTLSVQVFDPKAMGEASPQDAPARAATRGAGRVAWRRVPIHFVPSFHFCPI